MNAHTNHVTRKLISLVPHSVPWQHYTAEEFLPADVFDEVLGFLPKTKLGLSGTQGRQRTHRLPPSLESILTDDEVLDTISRQFSLQPDVRLLTEIAWFGRNGYAKHNDREDKVWNGQVYLAGEAKGTELYDADEKLAKVVEWKPNRFTCWLPPGGGKLHAAPQSSGRWVLLWWILKANKRRT